jgi:hypothetical protein
MLESRAPAENGSEIKRVLGFIKLQILLDIDFSATT